MLLVFACGVAGISTAGAANLKVLIIRGNYTDHPFAVSEQEWITRINTGTTELERFWKENSYGNIDDIAFTTTPVHTFASPGEDYLLSNNSDLDLDRTAAELINFAANSGYTILDYDVLLYSYPRIPGKRNLIAANNRYTGERGQIWFAGHELNTSGFVHEFGHALGVGHAGSIEGAPGVVYPGEIRDGRDGLFMMGSDGGGQRVGGFAPINLPMRNMLGWVPSANVIDVTQSGVYRIFEFEIPTIPGEIKLGLTLNINGREFWVSFCPTMTPRWAAFDSGGFERGVLVHRANQTPNAATTKGDTQTLDFTPGSFVGTSNENDWKDTRDGALQIGSSFTFPENDWIIRPLAVGTIGNLRYIDVEIDTGVSRFTGDGADVGNVSTTGSSSFAGGTYTITASGADIWNSADSFYYYSVPTGTVNGEMRAKVDSLGNTHPWAKAGVMLRENDAPGSKHVSVFVRPDGRVAMQWRATSNSSSSWASPLRGAAGSQKYVRIVKTGGNATGYYSLDGQDWIEIQTIAIDLGSTPKMGLAVTSHNNGTNTTASFSAVKSFSGVNAAEVFKYDFGTSGSPVESGYTRVTQNTQTGPVFWTNSSGNRGVRDRGVAGNLNRDLVFGTSSGAILRHPVSNGIWEVSWTTGDIYAHDHMAVKAEGITRVNGVSTARNEFVTRTFTVEVYDGNLDLEFVDASGPNIAWVVNALTYTKVADQQDAQVLRFDFGSGTSPLESGYERVSANTGSGAFRWTNTSSLNGLDRQQGNDLNRDFIFSSQPRTFLINVPSGNYEVTVTLGDASNSHDNMVIRAEGNVVASAINRARGEIKNEVFNVTVNDGSMELEFSDGGGSDPNWTVNAVVLQPL